MRSIIHRLSRLAGGMLLASLILAWPRVGSGESLTPGELGTARNRIAALTTLRDKVAADRVAVAQAQAKIEAAQDRLVKCRVEMDDYMRANGVDTERAARESLSIAGLTGAYDDAIKAAEHQDRVRVERLIREKAEARAAELSQQPEDSGAKEPGLLALEEELKNIREKWGHKRQGLYSSLSHYCIQARDTELELVMARYELADAQTQLDFHLGYYDESELERLQKIVANADAAGETVAAPADSPEVRAPPETEPPAEVAEAPEGADVPPAGFGDAPGEIVVEPLDGASPSLPAMTSEALLERFNDACSTRNWVLAQAALDEASPGASWYETGVQALKNERERAVEGDQMHFTKCVELESAMLAASRRRDWTAIQAFAAQARQEGCTLSAEAYSEIQRSIEQSQSREFQQQMMNAILMQTIINQDWQEDLDRPHRIQTPADTPPPQPPPRPHRPTMGGPVSGSGGT